MSSKLLVASAALVAAMSAQAAVSVTSAAFTYAESFDSLSSTVTSPATNVAWTNDSTLAGWSLFRASGTVAYQAGTGSSNTGAIYSFGSANASDRALGSVASGSTGTINYALALTNNTGSALNSFTLRFDGEQWRNGGVAAVHSLTVQYGFGATYAAVGSSWVTAGAGFDFASLVNTTTAAAVDGNVAGKASGLGGTIATNWSAGDTLWIRWTDIDNTGSDHGLAIDNVSLSVTAAVPEPSTYAMLLAGLGAVGFMARRRRRA